MLLDGGGEKGGGVCVEFVSPGERPVYGLEAMPWSDFGPELVKLNLNAVEQNEAILEVADLLKPQPAMVDFRRFCGAVLERERLCSTAVDGAVAFPHARTDAVRDLLIAVGRKASGIRFGPEGVSVQFIVVIGVPKTMVREYLGVAGRLARLFRDEPRRQALLEAVLAEDFAVCLREPSPGEG